MVFLSFFLTLPGERRSDPLEVFRISRFPGVADPNSWYDKELLVVNVSLALARIDFA